MSEPNKLPLVATSPISVLLFAQAFGTDTQESLDAWRRYLDTLSRSYEILLIQETRPEAPPDPAAPSMGVFTYERATGFRDALNSAIRSARYPLLAFCTADKQYSPDDLAGMLKVIDKVHLVVGYRVGGQTPVWRIIMDTVIGLLSRLVIGLPQEPRKGWLGSDGWGRRWVARWIFGVRVWDPECPYRLARREVFDHLPIQSGGAFMPIEMLAKANHLSCLLAEEPVTWHRPELPASEALSFGADARQVFRDPDFGLYVP